MGSWCSKAAAHSSSWLSMPVSFILLIVFFYRNCFSSACSSGFAWWEAWRPSRSSEMLHSACAAVSKKYCMEACRLVLARTARSLISWENRGGQDPGKASAAGPCASCCSRQALVLPVEKAGTACACGSLSQNFSTFIAGNTPLACSLSFFCCGSRSRLLILPTREVNHPLLFP